MFYHCPILYRGVKWTYISQSAALMSHNRFLQVCGPFWLLQVWVPLKTPTDLLFFLHSKHFRIHTVFMNDLHFWLRQHKWRNHQLYGVNFILGNDICIVKWTSGVNDKCVCFTNNLSCSRVEWESEGEGEDTAKQIDLTRCRFREQTVESRPRNSKGSEGTHTHTLNFTSEVHQQI